MQIDQMQKLLGHSIRALTTDTFFGGIGAGIMFPTGDKIGARNFGTELIDAERCGPHDENLGK